VSFLGQFLGALARRRETAVILLIGFGLPLFFLVGVAWPVEAIPPALKTLSAAIPSTFGIDALVRVNQTGAILADVRTDWLRLWQLAAAYAVMTCVVSWLGSRREVEHAH
jgi:ABC-2 type transport system permease protein